MNDRERPTDPQRRRLLRCACCALPLLALPEAARAALSGDGIGRLPALGDAAQGLLSPAVEMRLGERIMAQIRSDPSYLDDVLLREYLQGIVDRLTPAADATAEPEAPHRFVVEVLRDPTFNAFALPGGFICMHTGTVVDAQGGDELAAVFAHEMSHITQRHVAQKIAHAGADTLISVGSLVLAILAGAAGNGNAAQGLAMGGQAAAIDRTLAFSRNVERDADRVGIAVLRASGYPPQAMAAMLERLESMSRLDNGDVFAFLQDHPLDSERIADAQARGGDKPLPPDRSLGFWLMNARARALNRRRAEDLRRQAGLFAQPGAALPRRWPAQLAAWAYGEALCWRGAGDATRARAALQRARTLATPFTELERLPLDLLDGDLLLDAAQGNTGPPPGFLDPHEGRAGPSPAVGRSNADAALQLAQRLRALAPTSRAVLHLQARALLALPASAATRDFLRQQTVLHPHDVDLWRWLAQADAAGGRVAAQHRATAEAYALQGNLEGAIVQLKIAQKTPDTNYFEASIVDARLAVFKQRLARDKILDKMIPQ